MSHNNLLLCPQEIRAFEPRTKDPDVRVCVCVCVHAAGGSGRRGKEPYYSIPLELGDPIFRGKRRAAVVRKIILGLERSGRQSYLRT